MSDTSSNRGTMDTVRRLLKGNDVIPPAVLSDLGRKSMKEAFQDTHTEVSRAELQELWLRLQWTACSSVVTAQHFATACNAICVFLHCACQSVHREVRNFGFSEQVWFQAFEVVRRAFADSKHKPGLLVLDYLVRTLHQNSDQEISKIILQKAINEMIAIVVTGKPVIRLKEACLTLSYFLKQTQNILPVKQYFSYITLHHRLFLRKRCQEIDLRIQFVDTAVEDIFAEFLLALLVTASVSEARVAAIKLFSLLCSRTEKVDLSQNVDVASMVIEEFLTANDNALGDFTKNVFPTVIGDKTQLIRFLEQFDPNVDFSIPRLSIYLAILLVGRQKGFVGENELPTLVRRAVLDKMHVNSTENTDYAGFLRILMCDMPSLRLQGFTVLTASTATNAVVPTGALQCIARSFSYLHDSSEAHYRDSFVSVIRHFTQRLERSGYAAHRQLKISQSLEGDILLEYAIFLRKWNAFLYKELLPQVSYQRHILALQVLHYTMPVLVSIGMKTGLEKLYNMLVLALLNLTFDAFEDVRSQASDLLVRISHDDPVLISSILSEIQIVQNGQKLSSSTKRADHADALGRLFMLNSYANGQFTSADPSILGQAMQLGQTMQSNCKTLQLYVTEVSSLNPSSAFPLHGSILGLSYMIRLSSSNSPVLSQDIVDDLIDICNRIWALVQDDLCIDSPETETDEDVLDTYDGPKDLLAYSWRALRDSSLLMQSLLDRHPPNTALCQCIGALCFDQLKRLRHRGAFSAVEQTFVLCCQKCRSTEEQSYSGLTAVWLEAAFDEIQLQSTRLTRRSAGLPSMFAALLDPINPNQFLAIVQRLASAAKQPEIIPDTIQVNRLQLPQVHALNCLKDVITNSRFRTITEYLVVEMLNLAAECLSSEIWAIRNCGLMLFKACIYRLTPDSSSSYGAQIESANGSRLETPLAVAISLLKKSKISNGDNAIQTEGISNERQIEIVFAALELLSRIPYQEETSQTVDNLITSHFTSKLWAVREHAARLKASRTQFSEITTAIDSFLMLNLHAAANELHSKLLCCRYILQQHLPNTEATEKQIKIVNTILSRLQPYGVKMLNSRVHPLVQAAYLDLVNDVFSYVLSNKIVIDQTLKPSALLPEGFGASMAHSNFYLLRRAFALHRVHGILYQISRSGSSLEIKNHETSIDARLFSERDVALYTIEMLDEKILRSHAAGIFNVVLQISKYCTWSNVQAASLLMLSECIPAAQTRLTDHELKQLVRYLHLSYAEDRGLWNAWIRFAASLSKVFLSRGLDRDQSHFNNLVNALMISQQDETEVLTRLDAIKAVATIAVDVLADENVFSEKFEISRVRILFLLYDFLNDDDEDIRQIATNTTYDIVRNLYGLQHIIVGCALAAREQLAQLLQARFTKSRVFQANTIMRILDLAPAAGSSESVAIMTFCRKFPVSKMIQDHLQHANDLFAEEKQNLYIDDIAQIEAWAIVSQESHFDSLECFVLQTLTSWTLSGVQSLASLVRKEASHAMADDVSSKDQNDIIVNLVGITYNGRMLVLFVRVISLAGLLWRNGRISEDSVESSVSQHDVLKEQLRDLQTICQTFKAHERISVALQNSLNDSI